MNEAKSRRAVILCILDGYGWRDDAADNAVKMANTPIFDKNFEVSPSNFLRTDGAHVGLPDGQFGNSEVGHLNLGAGRIVIQDLPRIDAAIKDGLANRDVVSSFLSTALSASGRVHILGLLSPGGVHAHQRHFADVVKLLNEHGLTAVLHIVLDGRDTPPKASLSYWEEFQDLIKGLDKVEIATVSGRYYTMDRDTRWERTSLAYDAIAHAKGPKADQVVDVIRSSHEADITDEFVKPHVINGHNGAMDGDALLCINFRADRVRQIMSALTLPDFDGFERSKPIVWSAKAGMTSYSTTLDHVLDAWVPTPQLSELLGDVIASAGLQQLRMAETEKYPHVTYFFNGGREEPSKGEKRDMVSSPNVATYDLAPEMSAHELTNRCVNHFKTDMPSFVLINFANPDMVGHTGVLSAAIKAVETVDQCLGRVIEAARNAGATLIVTADHGNCELMRDPNTGGPHTSHTTNPVPIMMIDGPVQVGLRDGDLADVAPTVLELLGLKQPSAMTGKSLLSHGH